MSSFLKSVSQPTVLQRLTRRFRLLDVEKSTIPEALGLSKIITPVTNADQIISDPKASNTAKDLHAAAGTYVPFFTVPTGKRWHITGWFRGGTAANSEIDITINSVQAQITAQASNSNTQAMDFDLAPGDSIGMLTTGNAGDTSIAMSILYNEEDAY